MSGTRVLDLGQFITGPLAAVLLGEMGAEVIKVEAPPRGDPFREWGGESFSPTFAAFNRGKQSVVLDLKRDEERRRFLRLVRTADVLVENFRPGVATRLGIDYQRLRVQNPRLVYCAITGFGSEGPYRDRPSYDSVAQGLSGLTYLLLDPQRPRLRGPALADTITGQAAALAILGALVGRGATGQGRYVEVSMLHALVHFLASSVYGYQLTGSDPTPERRPHQSQAYAFRAGDGNVLLIHLSSPPKFWAGLCAAIGRPDLLDDPRFATLRDRVRNYETLAETLQAVFETRPRQAWLDLLVQHEVPCAEVNRISEVLADPQVRFLDLLHVDEVAGSFPRLRPAARFSEDDVPLLDRPPFLGEHTAAVLEALPNEG
ncbi:MAG: CoA transferase [Chloroflexi bacterium]|nr:CoA transferase [Chloroflexota bacterium]